MDRYSGIAHFNCKKILVDCFYCTKFAVSLGSTFSQLAFTCSKLTIETLERRLAPCSNVSIVNFEHVNADWALTTFRAIYRDLYSASSYISIFDSLSSLFVFFVLFFFFVVVENLLAVK